MTLTLSSWLVIISLNTIMKTEKFKGGSKGCYRKKTLLPTTACAVTTKIPDMFFSTHIRHDGALSATREGNIIVNKAYHHQQQLGHQREPAHTHNKFISQGIIKL